MLKLKPLRLGPEIEYLGMRKSLPNLAKHPRSEAALFGFPKDLIHCQFHFQIKKRKSSVGQEVRGGLVTYLTMAYIVVLNPLILGFTQDVNGKFLGDGDSYF